jgi:hypothetical protein
MAHKLNHNQRLILVQKAHLYYCLRFPIDNSNKQKWYDEYQFYPEFSMDLNVKWTSMVLGNVALRNYYYPKLPVRSYPIHKPMTVTSMTCNVTR